MAKHTQGEWGVAKIDYGAEDDEVVTEVNGCMVNIAAVFGAGEYCEGRPNGEPEPSYSVSAEEAAANARLIAAAPDLLAALFGTLEYMEANCRTARAGTYAGDRIIAARAAIAKATGE